MWDCLICASSTSSSVSVSVVAASLIAPETTAGQRFHVREFLGRVYGDPSSPSSSPLWEERRSRARDASASDQQKGLLLADTVPSHELVYGELGLDALSTILDAIGVEEGDTFLDVGAGDGYLVAAAALLYPDHLECARGVEIVPGLWERSLEFRSRLLSDAGASGDPETPRMAPTEFLLGDVHGPSSDDTRLLGKALAETSLAVCFATTWSRGENHRRLPKLSAALGSRKGTGKGDGPASSQSQLPPRARCVVIDGRLDEEDGFDYQGELRIHCPDTLPYSTAHLYVKTT